MIDGRGAGLHHAFSADREWELRDLCENVMRPLQRHLIEAGFDGLARQAGFGNPAAAGNFLLETGASGEKTWVWIDLESGVPALFPLSPVAFFRFYLACAIKYGRPMFDDVDHHALGRYVAEHRAALIDALGRDAWRDLYENIRRLNECRAGWRAMSHLERGLSEHLASGAITSNQAARYRQQPLSWYGRTVRNGVSKIIELGYSRFAALLSLQRLGVFARSIGKFVASSEFRTDLARGHVRSQIEKWRERGQLKSAEANGLVADLQDDEASLYVTDFGIHVAIKPAVKAMTWLLLPALYAVGAINEAVLVAGVIAGGSIGRTVYTLARVIAAIGRGAAARWIALGVGIVPVVGNLAFPLQLLYSGRVDGSPIAKFLVYNYASMLGRTVPVWGCRDSLLEHWCNHLGDLVVRDRKSMRAEPAIRPIAAQHKPALAQ